MSQMTIFLEKNRLPSITFPKTNDLKVVLEIIRGLYPKSTLCKSLWFKKSKEISTQEDYDRLLEEMEKDEVFLDFCKNPNTVNSFPPTLSCRSDPEKGDFQEIEISKDEGLFADAFRPRIPKSERADPRGQEDFSDSVSNLSVNDQPRNPMRVQERNLRTLGEIPGPNLQTLRGEQQAKSRKQDKEVQVDEKEKGEVPEVSKIQESETLQEKKGDSSQEKMNEEIQDHNLEQEEMNDGRQGEKSILKEEFFQKLSDSFSPDRRDEEVERMIVTAQTFHDSLGRDDDVGLELAKEIEKIEQENLPKFKILLTQAFELKDLRKFLQYFKLAEVISHLKYTVASKLDDITSKIHYSSSRIYQLMEDTLFEIIRTLNGSIALLEGFEKITSDSIKKEKIATDIKFIRQLANSSEIPQLLQKKIIDKSTKSIGNAVICLNHKLESKILGLFTKNAEFSKTCYEEFLDLYEAIDDLDKLFEADRLISLEKSMELRLSTLEDIMKEPKRCCYSSQFFTLSLLQKKIPAFQSTIQNIMNLVQERLLSPGMGELVISNSFESQIALKDIVLGLGKKIYENYPNDWKGKGIQIEEALPIN